MKIAFVTTDDGADIHDWSGIPYHMIDALEAASNEVILIRNLHPPDDLILKWVSRLRRKVLRQNYSRLRDASVLRYYAKQVDAQLEAIKPDIVFSPGTLPVSYLQSSIPVVTWTDATFASLLDYYPGYVGLPRDCVRAGHAAEQSALNRGALALYASDWAARSALDHYKADPGKVHVVPFGANLREMTSPAETNQRILARPTDTCRLIFLGVDWERKGGNIALALAAELNRRGLPTELDIAGVTPPPGTDLPSYVRSHGFISKREAKGAYEIEGLIGGANFLILPSRAECFGIVFAEASALGTPSLAAETGGIASAVREGINGFLVPISFHDEEVRQYSDIVLRLMRNPASYRALTLSCLEEHRNRLNWTSAGATVSRFMEGVLRRS